jgi:hypothetical protein
MVASRNGSVEPSIVFVFMIQDRVDVGIAKRIDPPRHLSVKKAVWGGPTRVSRLKILPRPIL